VVSFLWRLIYNVDYGLINTVLRGIGLGGLARAWLADPSVVIYAVTFPMTWQYTGFFVVIFLAGLTNIDPDLLDAAQIDGANGWQRGIHVILPLMAGTWRAVLILSTANGMKVFEHPFAMTHGGPGVSSAVIAVYAVINVFMRNHLTYGSTIAMAGVILSFGLILLAVLMMDYVILRRRQ
jgi:raffinose/stachyose/melibiose transport system permease protein